MGYSIKHRDRIFFKSYEFFSFGKNTGKNTSTNISGKYSWKLRDHAIKSARDTSKSFS